MWGVSGLLLGRARCSKVVFAFMPKSVQEVNRKGRRSSIMMERPSLPRKNRRRKAQVPVQGA